MSIEYDIYLKNHRSNVFHGFRWIITQIDPEKLNYILPDVHLTPTSSRIFMEHDLSKDSPIEYDAYDRYFYRDGKDTAEGRDEFNRAWLHHIHSNPHHWQYWVLIEDDSNADSKLMPIDIPDDYIIEMIADWWSFSWKEYLDASKLEPLGEVSKELYEIFDWYDEHKQKMIMTESTRLKVEMILEAIHERLDQLKEATIVDKNTIAIDI